MCRKQIGNHKKLSRLGVKSFLLEQIPLQKGLGVQDSQQEVISGLTCEGTVSFPDFCLS